MVDAQCFSEEGCTGRDAFTVRDEAEGTVREETYEVAWDGDVVEELSVGDGMVPGVLGAAAVLDRPEGLAGPLPVADRPGDRRGTDGAGCGKLAG